MPHIVHDLHAEYRLAPLGLGTPTPRLSWETDAVQLAYEIEVTGSHRSPFTTGRVDSADSVLLTWPASPLHSRERVAVRVRVWSSAGPSSWTEPLVLEAALLNRDDWSTDFVSPSPRADQVVGGRPAHLLRAEFTVADTVVDARMYSTAHGMYEVELNGRKVGDAVLAPGWTSYKHRIRFETADLTEQLRPGANALGVWLADGWYRGRLGFNGGIWDNYGADVALLLQLELRHADGHLEVVPLTDRWRVHTSPLTATGLYEGEVHDARALPAGWSTSGFDDSDWPAAAKLPLEDFPATLEPSAVAPVRVIEQLSPITAERTAEGRLRLDFGQNIAGRLHLRVRGPRGSTLVLRHAEVLDQDELALRPLRSAPARDRFTLAGTADEEWAPRFTYHGFRYAEIEGPLEDLDSLEVRADVLHTDMRRSGWFTSSHPGLTKLHENTVWGMRGNFVDLPTDCPQRDERLGWTGDIQVFGPAATFLYDCSATLTSWLHDLAAEQNAEGAVPNFVPWIECGFPSEPSAAWGDAAVLLPWTLYERTGDVGVLAAQYRSMQDWVNFVDGVSDERGLWSSGFQLGDWLDPKAPPENPGASATDRYLISSAYFARSAKVLAQTAAVLGDEVAEARYEQMHRRVKAAFNDEFISPSGRVVSDTPTAISIALVFDLFLSESQRAVAGQRLVELVKEGGYLIQTGFAGTPVICDALAMVGEIDTAYHLLLQEECPSWLYPVTMGATTVWERWDSMLPNGDINSGEMTSFNHYALGAVVDFLHRMVAGLAPAAPGYRTILVEPRPGGGLTAASAAHLTPFGLAEVAWERQDDVLSVDVTVPSGATAIIRLPNLAAATAGPGSHHFEVPFSPAKDDPKPEPLRNPHEPKMVAQLQES